REQPCAGDASVERGFVVLDGECGEHAVGQSYPEHEGKYPQQTRDCIVALEQDELAAKHAGCSDAGEEPGTNLMIDQVAPKRGGQPYRTQGREQPDDEEGDDVEPE